MRLVQQTESQALQTRWDVEGGAVLCSSHRRKQGRCVVRGAIPCDSACMRMISQDKGARFMMGLCLVMTRTRPARPISGRMSSRGADKSGGEGIRRCWIIERDNHRL